MVQRRIVDYGAPVIASTIKEMSASFITSAVLSGYRFSVESSNTLRVNPGVASTNEGVLIIEDESKFVEITNTSVSKDYTVYYEHTDVDITGGSAAELTKVEGLLTASDVNGVILGYVKYPGGGIPLSNSHFIQEPELAIGILRPNDFDGESIIPINQSSFLVNGTVGTINVTTALDTSPYSVYTKVRNNGLTSGSTSLVFPFKVGSQPFGKYQLRIATDVNTLITPEIVGTDNVAYTFASISGLTNITYNEELIPKDVEQNQNELVYFKLNVQLAASREVKIQLVSLNSYGLPV